MYTAPITAIDRMQQGLAPQSPRISPCQTKCLAGLLKGTSSPRQEAERLG